MARVGNIGKILLDSAHRIVFESGRWKFNLFLVVASTVLFSVLSHLLFNAVPRIDDSVAAIYQARLFAEGKLVWPLTADLHIWFDMFGVITPLDKPDYRAGMYPPGWPLLLVPGVWLGVNWIINPFLAGLMLVAVSELGRELFDSATGRIAALCGLCSPFVGAVAASHLSHIAAALFITLAWWSAVRLFRTNKTRYAVIGGLCLGFTFLIRPETAVFIGLVIAFVIVAKFRQACEIWRSLLLTFAICIAAAVSLLGFQAATVGVPGQVGHTIQMEGGEKLGFGRIPKSSYTYTPRKALDHTKRRMVALNSHLLGWPIPALLLVLAPLYLVRATRKDLWLYVPIVALTGFYFFYWYFEEWLPARYLFPAVPMMLILAVRGWQAWRVRLQRFRMTKRISNLILYGSFAYALVVGGPAYYHFYDHHHGDVEDHLPKVIDAAGLENALVFYHSSGKHRRMRAWNDFYATAASRNTLDLDGDIVFVRHGDLKYVNRSNHEMLKAFPGRNYYLYDFDQLNHAAKLWQLIVRDNRIIGRKLIAAVDDGA